MERDLKMRVQQINTQNNNSFGNSIVLKSENLGHIGVMTGELSKVLRENKSHVGIYRVPEKFFGKGEIYEIILTDKDEERGLNKLRDAFKIIRNEIQPGIRGRNKHGFLDRPMDNLWNNLISRLAQMSDKINIPYSPEGISLAKKDVKSVSSIAEAIRRFVAEKNQKWGK